MASPKVVLITGANNGIGYETVKIFLQSPKPYHVYLGSRSLQKGQDAIAKIRAEVPATTNTVEVLQVDVNSDESIEKAAAVVEKEQGRLDTLINNAGTLSVLFGINLSLTN